MLTAASIKESARIKSRSWTWPVLLVVLIGIISTVTVYEVHQHQHAHHSNAYLDSIYKSANGAEDDLAMQETLASLNDASSISDLPELETSGALAQCHVQEHTEYDGKVVRWGADNMQETAGDCCNTCGNAPDCNVWVWCGNPQGCGPGRQHKECWLKKNLVRNILDAEGLGHPGIPWTSGAIYSAEERARVLEVESARIRALRDNPKLPLVYLDVAIKGQLVGRMKFVLYTKDSPRAAENMRALCTGEKGLVPEGREGAGKPYHFKGNAFYRIIDRFIDQTGANTESVFGGQFKDDEGGLRLKHDRKGLLSMANAGPDTNTSHFSILMAPAPHLDGHYTIFGELVEGMEVAEKINALARGKKDNTAGPDEGALIVDSGQIR